MEHSPNVHKHIAEVVGVFAIAVLAVMGQQIVYNNQLQHEGIENIAEIGNQTALLSRAGIDPAEYSSNREFAAEGVIAAGLLGIVGRNIVLYRRSKAAQK